MPNYLDKIRGVTVQQDGVQLEGTGKVSTLNFKDQLLSYNPVTGVVDIGPELNTTRAEVNAATTTALAANTRTGNTLQANSNGALAAIDGVTLTTNNRVLVKDEATTANNGWYYVADPGSASSPWQLTRTADADVSAEFVSGAQSLVLAGTVNGGKRFTLTVGGSFVLNTDAVTFSESLIGSSVTWKDACRIATVSALPANTRSGNVLTASANGSINVGGPGGAWRDGVTLALEDRVLVKDEATGANNGIYRVTDLGSAGTPWTLTRAADAQVSAQVLPNIMVPISEGTTNSDKLFHLTTNGPITLNTTALTFERLTVAAAGSTGQLQYNNSGSIDGASGITVVGSETALAFGSNTPSTGYMRLGPTDAGTYALVQKTNDGSNDITIIGALSDNVVRVGHETTSPELHLRALNLIRVRLNGIHLFTFDRVGGGADEPRLICAASPAAWMEHATLSTATETTRRVFTISAQRKTGNTDTVGGTLTLRGGDASGAGGTHVGGNVIVTGGWAVGASGTRSGGHAQLGGGAGGTTYGNIYLGTDFTTSLNWQSAQRCILVQNRIAAPTGDATDGHFYWSDGGRPFWRFLATTLRLDGTATGATGGADTLPANPVGFITIQLNGTARKLPYYAT